MSRNPELPRIVMGDQLSPEDARQMAEVSGANLRVVTYTSSLLFRNGWNIVVSHDRLPSGLYMSGLHAFNTEVNLPTQSWTTRGVVIADDGVTIVRFDDKEGVDLLTRVNLRAGLAEVNTTLPEHSTELVRRAAEEARSRFSWKRQG